MTPEKKSISLTSLEINTSNPRFAMVANQKDAISKMIENQQGKLFNLAEDIVKNGLNPSDPTMVAQDTINKGKYIVLEGNRRIIALKLLHNPRLIPDEYKTIQNKFRQLASEFGRHPINEIECVVYPNMEDAYKWISLKHTGANEGVGTVTWDAQQRARFKKQIKGDSNFALQVIDCLTKDKDFDPILKDNLPKIRSSNLQRLLADKNVRERIGVSTENGRIVSQYPLEEIRKPLTRMISDLSDKNFKVKEIYHKTDREKYLKSFKPSELPNQSETIPTWEIVTASPPKGPKMKNVASVPPQSARKKLIPMSFNVRITSPRINAIYHELKNLELERFPNIGAIAFRVLLELSLDDYMDHTSLPKYEKESLSNKMDKVVNHLRSNRLITPDELKPLNVAHSNLNDILSPNTLNAYVHNPYIHPNISNLLNTWDNVAPFFAKLWETK